MVLALLALLFSSRASAQFIQYIAPGSLGIEPQDIKERLEDGSENARWRFGKLRVEPQVLVRDLAYRTNIFGAPKGEEEVDDYHLLVAAGLNGYLPLGQKAMFSAFVTPEYSWWSDNSDLRQFNVSAGAGLFGFFNRLTVTADARRLEQESTLNAEVSAPIQIEEERLALGLEIELQRSIFAFAALRVSEYRHSGDAAEVIDDLNLSELDRDYDSLRTGLRFALGRSWSLALGVEDSENTFLLDPGLRSNEGSSNPFTELRYDGNRVNARISVSDTELDFAEGSPLTGFSSDTGSGRIGWTSRRELSVSLYGSRNVVFSVSDVDSLFVEERIGVSISRRLSTRFNWLVFVEDGELEFTGPEVDDRVDDLDIYGVSLEYDLSDRFALVLAVEETDVESTLPEFDRSTGTLGLRLAVRGNLFPF